MDLHSRTDPALRGRISAGAAAVIPVGATEQHGPHLPVSTDSDIASAVAAAVGRGPRFLVAPSVSTGVSFEHAPFFQISIRESTLQTLLGDVCDSLHANGIRDIFLINGHYGNRGALSGFASGRENDMPRVHALSYWRFTRSRFDHGGFVETSLMLAVSDLVRMSRARRGLVTDGMEPSSVERLKRAAAESFPAATGNGVWGDPRSATAEAGRRILAEIVRNLRRECLGRLDGTRPNEILI